MLKSVIHSIRCVGLLSKINFKRLVKYAQWQYVDRAKYEWYVKRFLFFFKKGYLGLD